MGSGFSKTCYICCNQITWKDKKGFCKTCLKYFHCRCVELFMDFDKQLCYNCLQLEVCIVCKDLDDNFSSKGRCIQCKQVAHGLVCMFLKEVGSFEGICNKCMTYWSCRICCSNTDLDICCLKCKTVYHKSCFVNFPVDGASWVCSYCGGLCSACKKKTAEFVTKTCAFCKKVFHKSCFIDDGNTNNLPPCRSDSYSYQIHKIRSKYDQKWVHERIERLTTKVLKKTSRRQNVEIKIYINDDVHIVGPGKANKMAIRLRENLKTVTNKTNEEDKTNEKGKKKKKDDDDDDDGIDVAWEFKTSGTYLSIATEKTFRGIGTVLGSLWAGITQILQGVTQGAITGSRRLAIGD